VRVPGCSIPERCCTGGKNSDVSRPGSTSRIASWLRQEENMYLSCPPHIARHLEPELRNCSVIRGQHAWVTQSVDGVRGDIPRLNSLGRKPREGFGFRYDANDSAQRSNRWRQSAARRRRLISPSPHQSARKCGACVMRRTDSSSTHSSKPRMSFVSSVHERQPRI
jgi:hypothetical protein